MLYHSQFKSVVQEATIDIYKKMELNFPKNLNSYFTLLFYESCVDYFAFRVYPRVRKFYGIKSFFFKEIDVLLCHGEFF